MRRRLLILSGLFCATLLTPVGVEPLDSQDAKNPASTTPESRIDGTVQMIDKESNTVTVRLRGKTAHQEVVVDEDTKYTFRNKPSSAADLKNGRRVIVLGTREKNRLHASRIDIRDEK